MAPAESSTKLPERVADSPGRSGFHLRSKIVEFVGRGDFGLASGQNPDGTYERLWFDESVSLDEVTFDAGVFLLRKVTASSLKTGQGAAKPAQPMPPAQAEPPSVRPTSATGGSVAVASTETRVLRLVGTVPPETWNRLGTKILPKLRSGSDLKIGVDFSLEVKNDSAPTLITELRQILQDLGLGDSLRVE